MNFVSHLAVARRYVGGRTFWLGAMLPDLASMAGVRIPTRVPAQVSPELAAGVALHHRTDDAFHGHPEFVALMGRCVVGLVDLGLARGPARAAAHVGVEMLLDGALAHDVGVVSDYESALAVPFDALAPLLADSAAAGALRRLLARLQERGFPFDYRDPEVVSRRIVGMLAARPRLRIAPENGDLLARVLGARQADVHERAPALFAAVHAALSARSPGHNEG